MLCAAFVGKQFLLVFFIYLVHHLNLLNDALEFSLSLFRILCVYFRINGILAKTWWLLELVDDRMDKVSVLVLVIWIPRS